jgi:2-polyprenyl-3-methyl-5-hydroxy-6-metoxy-1,4-benzoquinol methylase
MSATSAESTENKAVENLTAEMPDTHCPACLGNGRPLHLVVEARYRLIRCVRCRTEYFRPDPRLSCGSATTAVSEYWEAYKFDMYADDAVRQGYQQRYAATLDHAAKLDRIDSVLDIGCGIGNFVSYAEELGLSAYGVDVDHDAVAAARSRGLNVCHSDDLLALVPDDSIDAVTLWDVIEHLYDPLPVVAQALTKLRPGGLLLMETPDAAFPVRPLLLGLEAVTGGRVNLTGHMYYWEHKIYFTEAGMREILGRARCEMVSVRRDTSPRAKMQRIFSEYSKTSVQSKVLARAWPALEGISRGVGRGNKLIVIARLKD